MKIGYARTSTTEQMAGLEAQERELKAAGCAKVYSEQISGTKETGHGLLLHWNICVPVTY